MPGGKRWSTRHFLKEFVSQKVVQIVPRSTHQKTGWCWIANWQFYWPMSYVRLSLKICSLYETYTWGYTVRLLAFINIKLASCHLLLYVVHFCQKSENFVYAFICYKQKCKVVSLTLGHPVEASDKLRFPRCSWLLQAMLSRKFALARLSCIN